MGGDLSSKVIASGAAGRPDHWAGCPFDLFGLRAVVIAISNGMLCCLDALRWGRADLHTLVPNGDACVCAVIERWDLGWVDDA